jgi:CHAD domain-containing protein
MVSSTSKTARYTEVERKFEVTATTLSPSFAGLSAVARVEQIPSQKLDAVYFDTPTRDLAARHITLRRRTGGADAGWHLKLPSGPDARTEVRAPLGDGDTSDGVPDELREIVLGIVRDKPLEPVARISTHRDVSVLYGQDGTALAEFCDDHVTASAAGHEDDAQRWREWELELVPRGDQEADPDLLDRLSNRLLDVGAEPAGHGSKLARTLSTASTVAGAEGPATPEPTDAVHRAIAEHVDNLLVWDRAVRADADDAVHQMRVTTRKIRSLLQESADAFGSVDGILDELRELATVLGVARDAEVLAERYEHALDDLPADLVRGPVRERLVGGARTRYESGLRRAHLAMRSQRYFRLLDALEGLVASSPDTDTGPASATIGAAYKRVRKAVKKAEQTAADPQAGVEDRNHALHRIRKRAKRLRYTASATGKRRVARRAKAVQSLLGDHQDAVVSMEHLSTQARAAHAAGEDTFTYGLLYQQEDELAWQARTQLQGLLKNLKKAVSKAV